MLAMTIRPVSEADRAAVAEMTRHTWDDGDYIMEVFDDWRQGADGPFLAAEVGGQLAAIAKSTHLGPAEEWIEGVRVAPAWRGRGIARRLLAHQMQLAMARGATVARYATASNNVAMHRIAQGFGMAPVGSYVAYAAPALPGEPQARAALPDDATTLWDWLQRSEAYRHTRGLFDAGWRWRCLSETALLEQTQMANVLIWGTNATPHVVGILHREDDDDTLRVGFVGGDDAALMAAAEDLRRVAHRGGQATVSVMLPDAPGPRAVFQGAGYARWESPIELYVFAAPLDAALQERVASVLARGDAIA